MRAAVAVLLAAGAAFAADPQTRRTVRVPVFTQNDGQFTAKLANGQDVRIQRVRTPKDDLVVLTVLDLAGDIALIDPARNAFVETMKTLPPSTWIGLMRAQDGLQVLLDPGPDRDNASETLLAMPITGKAGLLDTVETAARLGDAIAVKSAVRVAVLFITDSNVRNYREDFTNPVINSSDSRDLSRRFPEGLVKERIARVTDRLSAAQTPVFIVHLDYSNERLNEAYQSGLMRIALSTGGKATFCRSQADVPDAVAGMLATIQNMYQLVVQLPPKSPNVVSLAVEQAGAPVEFRGRFALK